MSGPPPGHVAAKIVIKVWDNGALSVEGPMDERPWVLAVLQNAIDAVRAYRRPGIVGVPARDVDLGKAAPAALGGGK